MKDQFKEFFKENVPHPTGWAVKHAINPKVLTNRLAGKRISAVKGQLLAIILLNEYGIKIDPIDICIPGNSGSRPK